MNESGEKDDVLEEMDEHMRNVIASNIMRRLPFNGN